MSNGSRRTSEELRREQAPRRRQWSGLWLAGSLSLVGGCHHARPSQSPDLQAELAAVTSRDLLSLAVSHARAGDLMRAEQYLSAARQRGHDATEVAYWLVRVCVAGGRYQSALAHASDYLRDHPSDWSLRLVVATLHEALGDASRAELELEHVVAHAPGIALPHYRLAMLYRNRTSDQARAKAHLEEYLRLTPNGRHAVEARAALSEVTDLSVGPRLIPHPSTGEVNEEDSL